MLQLARLKIFNYNNYMEKCFKGGTGMKYRELGLKDQLPEMSEEEQYKLLATDGMLVKRPLIVGDDFVLIGFKEAQWKETL